MSQLFIAAFGLTAIYFANEQRADLRKWAPIFGLLSQPFWFYTTYTAEQWGIFVLSIAYAILWARGFVFCWVLKR